MTVTTERRITHHELTSVVIACESCHAEIALDVSQEAQVRRFFGEFEPRYPELQCAVCERHIDPAVIRALTDLIRLHQHLRGTPGVLTFRILEPAPPK